MFIYHFANSKAIPNGLDWFTTLQKRLLIQILYITFFKITFKFLKSVLPFLRKGRFRVKNLFTHTHILTHTFSKFGLIWFRITKQKLANRLFYENIKKIGKLIKGTNFPNEQLTKETLFWSICSFFDEPPFSRYNFLYNDENNVFY